MSTLLTITSSLFGSAGQSSKLVADFAGDWLADHPEGRIINRDLSSSDLPHLSGEAFSGFRTEPTARTPSQQRAAQLSQSLIDELRLADVVALGLPMYNFSVPSTLKAWMDHVARAGVTFEYTSNGPRGLIDSKPIYVFATRGGRYRDSEADTQTGLIRQFFGLLGLDDVRFVYAEGLAMGEGSVEQAQADVREQLQSLAA